MASTPRSESSSVPPSGGRPRRRTRRGWRLFLDLFLALSLATGIWTWLWASTGLEGLVLASAALVALLGVLSVAGLTARLWRERGLSVKHAILTVSGLVGSGACLYVPWKAQYRGLRASLGYAPIWAPPPVEYSDPGWYQFSSPDLERLVLELLAVGALAGVALLLTGSFKKNEKNE